MNTTTMSSSNSLLSIPSMTSIISTYASLSTSYYLARNLLNDMIPYQVREFVISKLGFFFDYYASKTQLLTLIIDEHIGYHRNQVFDAASLYLSTLISPSTRKLKVKKTHGSSKINVGIEKGEEVEDCFDGIALTWRFVCQEGGENHANNKTFELVFDGKARSKIIDEYLPLVLSKAEQLKHKDRKVKIYSRECSPSRYNDDEEDYGGGMSRWGCINLEHPSTFDTLALEPELKRTIIDDLNRFLERRDYYKRVGKAWKRGYLLYGPPGTGKSSLIAAMANYLKFDVYDLMLSSVSSDWELRRILIGTTNRSILVIEDIDCSIEFHDRQDCNNSYSRNNRNDSVTLSGLLNFIDGLWSGCGEERIIVFTTNFKDRLDPALLRPGRMDMHINLSYLTPSAFHVLLYNYLGIRHHSMLAEIEELIANVKVTPAQVAEELMKSDDADISLSGLVHFLQMRKKEEEEMEYDEVPTEDEEGDDETKGVTSDVENGELEDEDNNKKGEGED